MVQAAHIALTISPMTGKAIRMRGYPFTFALA
jgi:hypothetical protein